jgi:hypothetical protein
MLEVFEASESLSCEDFTTSAIECLFRKLPGNVLETVSLSATTATMKPWNEDIKNCD